MTLAPITPAPTDGAGLAAGSTPSDGGDPTSAGDFLAAILQALAPDAGQATDAGPAPAEATDSSTDPAALGLVVPPGLAAQLMPTPVVAGAGPDVDGTGAAAGAVDGATAGAGAPAVPTAPGHANVAAGAAVAPTGPTGDIRMSGDAPATAAPSTPSAPEQAAAPAPAAARGTEAARTSDRADAAPATPDPNAVTASASAQTGTDADGSRPDTSAAPTPTAPMTTSISGPATAPTVSRTEPAGTSSTQHVTGQVFPEVTRLVSRGDGTHRITLDLNPESLGEVRVVMTVRDGAVHVRFAAGHEAGRALLDGSAELTRLLGAAGASETRIVVRDASAALQPTTGAADSTLAGGDLGLGPGGHRSQDQHAGTRAEHHATDGSDTTTPGPRGAGANPPRSIQPVTRTRTAGVDVTM